MINFNMAALNPTVTTLRLGTLGTGRAVTVTQLPVGNHVTPGTTNEQTNEPSN